VGPGEVVARLQQQRRLAHARIAAHQNDRPGHQPAAQHPIELAHPGGKPGVVRRIYLAEPYRLRRRLSGRRSAAGRQAAPRRGRRRLHFPHAVPGPARRTAAQPPRGFIPALVTRILDPRRFGGHRALLTKNRGKCSMSSHYTIRKCALSSTVRGVRRRRYDARRARWYDARQANGATSFEPNGVTPFGPGGALRRSGRRSGDRPHSPAAVARQHAAKGNLAACPLCTSHRSARLRPARLHPGLDCRVDTDDDLFAKPSHGCHYSPETVSPKYKVQWPGWGPAEPVLFHILTRTESPLSSSFH